MISDTKPSRTIVSTEGCMNRAQNISSVKTFEYVLGNSDRHLSILQISHSFSIEFLGFSSILWLGWILVDCQEDLIDFMALQEQVLIGMQPPLEGRGK
ncbi:hypothetical protein TNIN_316221 [Trichonephila inaurata madagascariensis]|uniref:Uncharacterized protein n=1 Tax=Trichonephila inaurata madagascariensis TaxID=2747483 RepID=A0A8X6X820_9ARAC|nr:hypothetical protein TNIN_444391 [Trichonephila inaurata madagascariensis]GFY50140.1 hypothetical protein TNIN_316221 [Trichonephila inaurata madagascariensis]